MSTCSVQTVTTHVHPPLTLMGSGTGSHSGSGSSSASNSPPPPPIKSEPIHTPPSSAASTPVVSPPAHRSPPVGLLNTRNLVQDEKLVVATLASLNSGDPSNIIKQDLRLIIQSRRKAEGKGELTVDFKTPPKDELTEEEWERARKRRDQNRLAAQRFRQKQRKLSSTLCEQQLTSEELEKRARRRELNRLAAKRSREKGQRRKDSLIQEIQMLQARNMECECAKTSLVEERDSLVEALRGHLPRCHDPVAIARSAQLLAFSQRLAHLLDCALPRTPGQPVPDRPLDHALSVDAAGSGEAISGVVLQAPPPAQPPPPPHTPLSLNKPRPSAHTTPLPSPSPGMMSTLPSAALTAVPGASAYHHHPPPPPPIPPGHLSSPPDSPGVCGPPPHGPVVGHAERVSVERPLPGRGLQLDTAPIVAARDERGHHHHHPHYRGVPPPHSPPLSPRQPPETGLSSHVPSRPHPHPFSSSTPSTPTHLLPSHPHPPLFALASQGEAVSADCGGTGAPLVRDAVSVPATFSLSMPAGPRIETVTPSAPLSLPSHLIGQREAGHHLVGRGEPLDPREHRATPRDPEPHPCSFDAPRPSSSISSAPSSLPFGSSSSGSGGAGFRRGPVQRVASFHGVTLPPGEQVAPLNLSKRRKSEDFGMAGSFGEFCPEPGFSGLQTWPPAGLWVKREQEEEELPLNLVCREQRAGRSGDVGPLNLAKREMSDVSGSDSDVSMASTSRKLTRYSSLDDVN